MASVGMVRRADTEIGATGISIYGGKHWNIEDYNPDLNNQRGMLIYDKMRSSDGEISASLARLTLPLLSAEWRTDPAEGEPRAQEIADFVDDVLIKRKYFTSYQDDSWNDFVRQAMLMLPFGFMAFEKVWGVNEKGQQVIVKLAPRLPKTFREFQFLGPGGSFSGAVQYTWSPRSGKFEVITIPAEKLMLLIFGREGDNYWGRSILRSSYKHWDLKDTILWVDAASIERYGMGALEIHATEDVTDPEKANAEESAKQFRSHETQYLFTPAKFLATFHYPPAGTSRAIESAHYHDQQISRSMLTEFMATGTMQTGSRAIVAAKIDLLMMAEKGTADIIESAMNRQVIPELVERNFGRQNVLPEIKCEDLDKMVGSQWATMMKDLVDSRVVIPDKRLRDYARKVIDLPEEDVSTQDRGLPPVVNTVDGTPAPVPGVQADKPKLPAGKPLLKPPSEAELKARFDVLVAAMQSSSLAREPFAHEQFAAFTEYQKYLDLEPLRIWTRVVKGYRDRIILDVAGQAAQASDMDLAKAKFSPKLENPLVRDLAKALLAVYVEGRKTVVAERDRQLSGKPIPPMAMQTDGEPDIQPSASQSKWIRAIAAGFVGGMISALGDAARDAGQTARNVNDTEEEQVAAVASSLSGMSEAMQIADLGGAVNRSFINGRDEQAQSMAGEIETEYYSAIMDASTCDPCGSLDGQEQGPGDANFETPNPDCAGGDRCRCVTIYVWREAAA